MSEADTAVAVGRGEVPSAGHPRMLALAERATVTAVVGALEAGTTAVRVRVELDHLTPARSSPTWRLGRCWSGSARAQLPDDRRRADPCLADAGGGAGTGSGADQVGCAFVDRDLGGDPEGLATGCGAKRPN